MTWFIWSYEWGKVGKKEEGAENTSEIEII